MKKILMGLIAVSSLSFTADINAGNLADKAFTTTGTISVTGTITNTLPTAKYVIFTSADGTLVGATDTLQLPSIKVAKTADEMLMDGTPNIIYVKTVNGSDIANLENETVIFDLSGLNPAYTNLVKKTVPELANTSVPVGSLLSTSDITAIGDTLFGNRKYELSSWGEIVTIPEGIVGRLPEEISFTHSKKGELTLSLVKSASFGNAPSH